MKMELLINVHVKFIHNHNSEPVHGTKYKARLYDKDLINDDFLGESALDTEGVAKFRIGPKQYRTEDSLLENRPDFYITLLSEGTQIFKTPVAANIDLSTKADFNTQDGESINMGTFMVG